MKKALLLTLLVFGVLALAAQVPLGKGEKQLNAGVGFSGYGLPVYVGLDYGLADLNNNLGNITVGGELSFRSWGSSGWRYSIVGISANGNWHFNEMLNLPPEIDTYVGLSLGYLAWLYPSGYTGPRYNSLGLAGQIGARYFFSNNLGVQVEAGGGTVSGGKIGVTYKLN